MQTLLSVENSPPFAAPLRFFLTAPLFALLAGALTVLAGEDVFLSRWTPAALAVTHLLTLGFMLQIMIGALIQILPVVAGANLPRPLALARLVHGGLTVGTLMLAAGFYYGEAAWLAAGALLVVLFALHFLALAGWTLRGVPTTSPTIGGIKFSLVGLLFTLGLGGILVLAMRFAWPLPLIALTDWHAAWGLGGWGGILLAAVAYVVVPMFQLTPGYPARPAWLFPPAVIAALALWGSGLWADWPGLVRLGQGGLAAAGMAFAGLTLRLQGKRRRAKPDTTYRYWQIGLLASLTALGLLLASAAWPPLADWAFWPLLIGGLLLLGGYLPFIVGMLYKIVPFLAWLHLQNQAGGRAVPNMNQLLPAVVMRRQLWAHGAALGAFALALFWPALFARPAGLALMGAAGALWWNIFAAVRRYRTALATPAPTKTA